MISRNLLNILVSSVPFVSAGCSTGGCGTGGVSFDLGSGRVNDTSSLFRIDPASQFDRLSLKNYSSSAFLVGKFDHTQTGKLLHTAFKCINEIAELSVPALGISGIGRMTQYVNKFPHVPDSSESKAKIYGLLKICVSLVPPAYFRIYYSAFEGSRYVECYRILESLYCPGYKNESRIIEIIRCKNTCKNAPGGFIFFNLDTDKSYAVCRDDSVDVFDVQTFFFLPDLVLCFDKFIATSLHFDRVVVTQLYECCLISHCLYSLFIAKLEELYDNYHLLTSREQCIAILRLKFFAFHIIAYALTDAGVIDHKNEYEVSLLDIFDRKTEGFFSAYAVGLGILNK